MHVKKNSKFRNTDKRIRAMLLACVMACSLFNGVSPVAYAASGDWDSATTEEFEEADTATKILKDTHGRIVLWKWQKVTQSNANELLNDGRYHPSMLVRMDASGSYKGFVSTYADKEHVFRGDQSNWYKTEFDALGKDNSSATGVAGAFNQFENYYIKLDDDGKSLDDTDHFGSSVFYTTGSPMGVPYIKANKLGNNLRTKLKDRNTYRIDTNIVLARGSAKDPNDVSFYEVMEGMLGEEDYFIEKYWRGSGGEKNEPFMAIVKPSDTYWGDKYQFCFQPFGAESGGRGDTWVVKADLNEEDDSDLDGLDYAISDYWQSDSGQDIGGFSTTLVCREGYLMALDVRKFGGNGPCISASSYGIGARAHTSGRNIYDVSLSNSECRFMWYVGTPYTFASLVGQGGDPVTGEGGTTTIGKGELLEINSAEFMDVNNHLQRSDGIILPEGSKIVVNDGGVLSVTTNLINNGKIINNGGTIIIKDGGCISPFLETKEASMQCTNGGKIVVMPEGRLFCLSDAYRDSGSINDVANLGVCSLKLTGGSALINYGLFANSFCQIDKGSVIENRGEGLIMAAVKRDSINRLLYNVNITKNGDFSEVEGLSDIDGYDYVKNVSGTYIMYFGITCPQSFNGLASSLESYDMNNGGTLRNDKTATLARYVFSENYTFEKFCNEKIAANYPNSATIVKEYMSKRYASDNAELLCYYDAIRLVNVVEPEY